MSDESEDDRKLMELERNVIAFQTQRQVLKAMVDGFTDDGSAQWLHIPLALQVTENTYPTPVKMTARRVAELGGIGMEFDQFEVQIEGISQQLSVDGSVSINISDLVQDACTTALNKVELNLMEARQAMADYNNPPF